MVYIRKTGSSMKQMAYAKRAFGAKGETKRDIALDCGYSPNVARSVVTHIENKRGYNNAMIALAVDSNNLALAAMHEFKARGFEDFSNKELVGALNAIGSAWAKFNVAPKVRNDHPSDNKLRTVILQQVENQTVAPDQIATKIPEVPEESQSPATTTTPRSDQPAPEVVGVVDEKMDF